MSVLDEISRVERENEALREEIERLRAQLSGSAERARSELDRADKLRARNEACAALRREARELTDTLDARERELAERRRADYRHGRDPTRQLAEALEALLGLFRRGPR